MIWWLAALNSLAAFSSVGFGLIALLRPSLMTPKETTTSAGSRFFATMYASRAIPLGLAVGIVVWVVPATPITLILLGAATIAQFADILLGIRTHLWGMAMGATFATLCHTTAFIVLSY